MGSYDYDLVVLGAGSGGVRASRIAAGYGARVAVIEERYLGGTCVNVGCVPKKLLVYGSQFREELAHAAGYGWEIARATASWPRLCDFTQSEVRRLNDVYERLLLGSNVDIVHGQARLKGPHTVEVDGRTICGKWLLLATGSWPAMPLVKGVEHGISSNEVFELERLPEQVVVVGGGYIACEFAGIFHGLGSRVTIVHRGSLLLRGFDLDVRKTITRSLARRGLDVCTDAQVSEVSSHGDLKRVRLAAGSVVEADEVLFATGRAPRTRGIGLAEIGVRTSRSGHVMTDEYGRTSIANIFAVGDCSNPMALTPVALAEGSAVAKTLFGATPTRPDLRCVPTAVFSQPPVATVGLTEEQARASGADILVYRNEFRPLRQVVSRYGEPSIMKLVVDKHTQRVLGCHMVGLDAPEIIQGFAVALKCNATKIQFDATLGIHPTSAEEFVTMGSPS
ncbi:MAG: glutathione-disulfide reductase [Proteobacteria bacterium]|nr:glutathione-disulfide reductase [Pseudomonadota bacterium]